MYRYDDMAKRAARGYAVADVFYKWRFPSVVIERPERPCFDGVTTILRVGSKTMKVDEKHDQKSRPTIFIETYSNTVSVPARRGWLYNTQSDHILYIVHPDAAFYWIPTQALRATWRVMGDSWVNKYGVHTIDNGPFQKALGVGVPADVLVRCVEGAEAYLATFQRTF